MLCQSVFSCQFRRAYPAVAQTERAAYACGRIKPSQTPREPLPTADAELLGANNTKQKRRNAATETLLEKVRDWWIQSVIFFHLKNWDRQGRS